jgi:hypothetical protein
MNKDRFFAFGCSFTNWPDYPTWADFIGINFKEYYNFGKPGACNTFIMQKLYEIDEVFNLNSETDFVMIALTGFGRFSYLEIPEKRYPEEIFEYKWETHGDILFGDEGHPEKVKIIRKNLYNWPWAAYNSWIAFKLMKQLLVSKNIEHKVIMAIDNSHFINDAEILQINHKFKNIGNIVPKIENIYKTLDVDLPIGLYRRQNEDIYEPMGDDSREHPIKEIYYDYIQKYIPELITEKSKQLLNTPNESWQSMFNHRVTHIKQ